MGKRGRSLTMVPKSAEAGNLYESAPAIKKRGGLRSCDFFIEKRLKKRWREEILAEKMEDVVSGERLQARVRLRGPVAVWLNTKKAKRLWSPGLRERDNQTRSTLLQVMPREGGRGLEAQRGEIRILTSQRI